MNWKINYWTLITFIVLGGLVYSCMDTSDKNDDWKYKITQIDANVETILKNLHPFETSCNIDTTIISKDTAVNRIDRYRTKIANIKASLKDTTNLPVNFGKGYFTLPKCELQNMWDTMPTNQKEVYIHLTLEDVPNSSGSKQTQICAVLSEVNDLSNIGQPAEALIFDFIDPCPPCKD